MAQSDNKWLYLFQRYTKRMWFRASLYCGLGILTALLGAVTRPLFPDGFASNIGANSIGNILSILATSMLAVTTFSLSTMVQAYSAAAQSATPRATLLLIEDGSAQSALATFIGAFLFSIVGLIAYSTGIYGDGGRLVLLAAAVAVIVLITITLLRWIDQLSRFGRVAETIDLVENATRSAMQLRARKPWMGGVPSQGAPRGDWPVATDQIGYVQYLDMQRLGRLSEERGVSIHVASLPGAFTVQGRPLAMVSGAFDEDLARDIRKAFAVGDARTFEHDPRYGLVVLTEIAVRALSPAINDPGTCIDVIGTVVRLISGWSEARIRQTGHAQIDYPHVFVPGLDEADFFDDVFPLIAREGAHMREIGIRLQEAFDALAMIDFPPCRTAANRHARMALERAVEAIKYPDDLEAVRRVALESAAEPLDPRPGRDGGA